MKNNKKKSMYEEIMEEVRNNPILTEEESQSIDLDEVVDELFDKEFLEEISIIDNMAQQYSEEKDKIKVKALIDEAIKKNKLLHESINKSRNT